MPVESAQNLGSVDLVPMHPEIDMIHRLSENVVRLVTFQKKSEDQQHEQDSSCRDPEGLSRFHGFRLIGAQVFQWWWVH